MDLPKNRQLENQVEAIILSQVSGSPFHGQDPTHHIEKWTSDRALNFVHHSPGAAVGQTIQLTDLPTCSEAVGFPHEQKREQEAH